MSLIGDIITPKLANKKIGLYFGTFNPIHVGHLIIANHMVENSELDEVWFVVTPHNPFKKKDTLLNDYHRFDMVQRAIENYPKLRASDIEFKMDQPNYTSKTLGLLIEKYPTHEFALIMGEDNLQNFHKWKNHEYIISNHSLYVYPRPGAKKGEYHNHNKVNLVENVPQMEISATFIRQSIKNGKNVRPMLPEGIGEYINEQLFYR
ncbi:MAG: nicotinate-nucleotide adenylyltransferase [Ichthyobacteriaceae bacterium]|nr:nicotinate-nucleotide adenylyltransferase [Ichthyobacteriaceae bacterium]